MDTLGIVLRTTVGLENLEVVKTGTSIECESYLFKQLMPNEFVRNLKQLNTENGYMYTVEKKENGEWKEYKYILLFSNNY